MVRGRQTPSLGVPCRLVVLKGLAQPPPSLERSGPRHVEERVLAEGLTDLSSNLPGASVSIPAK